MVAMLSRNTAAPTAKIEFHAGGVTTNGQVVRIVRFYSSTRAAHQTQLHANPFGHPDHAPRSSSEHLLPDERSRTTGQNGYKGR